MSHFSDKIKTVLAHPLTLFVGMALGVAIGQWGESIHLFMDMIANIYLRLMKMCIIPLIASLIIVNTSRIIRSGSALLSRWLMYWFACMFFVILLTITIAYSCSDYLIQDAKTLNTIQSIATGEKYTIHEIDYYTAQQEIENIENSLVNVIYNIFPENIFQSLAENHMLSIVFFFVLIGTMLAYMPTEKTTRVFTFFDAVYEMFSTILNFLLIFLPFGIMALFSQQFSDPQVFTLIQTLFPLFTMQVGISALICLAFLFIIAYQTKTSIITNLKAIKRSFFLAIGTCNSMACIPTAIEDTQKYLNISPNSSNTILPISAVINEAGFLIFIVSLAIYGVTVYDVDMTLSGLIMIGVTSILFALSTMGLPAVVAASMFTLILDPFLLPSDLIMAIFLILIPLADPIITFTNIYSNVAIVSALDKKDALE